MKSWCNKKIQTIDSHLLSFGIFGIWIDENDRIFGSSSSSVNLLTVFSLTVVKWALIRKELANVKLNEILYK